MDSAQKELAEAAVAAELGTAWIGRSYRYLESVGSTNDYLKRKVESGEADDPPPGAVVLTNYQKRGRGRFGRSWFAPPNSSLLFSVLFRPDWPANRLSWLVMLAGVGAAEAIETITGIPTYLKWPNDLVTKQGEIWAKVGGILLEGAVTPGQRLAHAILGIGINVNVDVDELPPTAQPATSLMVAAGKTVSRLSLLAALLQRLEQLYEAADEGISPKTSWNKRLITLQQRVEVKHVGQETVIVGLAVGTDDLGQLLVRDDNGQLHTISSADVSLRGDG